MREHGAALFDVLLRKLERFAPLAVPERAAIQAWPADVRRVERGRGISPECGETQGCLLLVDGLAARHKVTREGKQQILAFLFPGDIVNLERYFGRSDDADIVAISPVRIATVPLHAMRHAVDRHPALAQAFAAHMLAEAAIGREWLLNVGQRSAASRVAHLLCEAAVRLSVTGFGEPTSFAFPFTQTHLAAALGLTAVHINRTLCMLQGQELVAYRAHHVTILDLPKLKRLGDFDPAYLGELAAIA